MPASSIKRSWPRTRSAWQPFPRPAANRRSANPTRRSVVVLPNHYHVLVETRDVLALLRDIGKMHGRTSFHWNGEDTQRGRQVWFNCAETSMKSDRHFWATLKLCASNPVYHGYVEQW